MSEEFKFSLTCHIFVFSIPRKVLSEKLTFTHSLALYWNCRNLWHRFLTLLGFGGTLGNFLQPPPRASPTESLGTEVALWELECQVGWATSSLRTKSLVTPTALAGLRAGTAHPSWSETHGHNCAWAQLRMGGEVLFVRGLPGASSFCQLHHPRRPALAL